ncbi:MAG TPA: hypothetical protein VNN21_05990 [Dehalococcoidia bacterium]|nr:hypothetical protein [Dehalococcoidia bacterium]
MTQNHEDAVARAAGLIAEAIRALQEAAAAEAGVSRAELAQSRAAIASLSERLERQLAEEREQRQLVADQLSNLASSLDRLVNHLHGLSQLMAELLERLATPAAPAAAAEPPEPTFQPGGEGVSLSLSGVPGFQALMDIQKALMAMEPVAAASVERFQEGESRILLQLRSPISASELAASLHRSTGHAIVVEEARPELMRLRLKVVGA